MTEEQYDELLNDFFGNYVHCKELRFGQQFINFFTKHGYRLKDQDMSANIFYMKSYMHCRDKIEDLSCDDWEEM